MDKGRREVTRPTEGNLALVKFPSPGSRVVDLIIFIRWGSGWYSRGDAIVRPEAGEDLNVREVNLPQEFGELFLG